MSERSVSVPLLMASLLGAKVLVKYGSSLAGDFDPEVSCFWGMKLLLLLWGT
jgi:hypothetical protein